MSAIAYDHADVPVRADFTEAHARFWARLARPGTWWNGVPRVAIAREAGAARQCPLCARRKAALAAARRTLVEAMGPAAMVDAAGVASNFERMARIADATGIPLGEPMEQATGELRTRLGLDALRAR